MRSFQCLVEGKNLSILRPPKQFQNRIMVLKLTSLIMMVRELMNTSTIVTPDVKRQYFVTLMGVVDGGVQQRVLGFYVIPHHANQRTVLLTLVRK